MKNLKGLQIPAAIACGAVGMLIVAGVALNKEKTVNSSKPASTEKVEFLKKCSEEVNSGNDTCLKKVQEFPLTFWKGIE